MLQKLYSALEQNRMTFNEWSKTKVKLYEHGHLHGRIPSERGQNENTGIIL